MLYRDRNRSYSLATIFPRLEPNRKLIEDTKSGN